MKRWNETKKWIKCIPKFEFMISVSWKTCPFLPGRHWVCRAGEGRGQCWRWCLHIHADRLWWSQWSHCGSYGADDPSGPSLSDPSRCRSSAGTPTVCTPTFKDKNLKCVLVWVNIAEVTNLWTTVLLWPLTSKLTILSMFVYALKLQLRLKIVGLNSICSKIGK